VRVARKEVRAEIASLKKANTQPGHPRHAHVGDEASDGARAFRLQEALGRVEGGGGQAGGVEQVLRGVSNRLIVVHDRYGRVVAHLDFPAGLER
jgi:hypothetical protein